MTRPILLLSALMTLLVATVSNAQEVKSNASDQTALSLTIYNAGRALIKDQRELTVSRPTRQLAFMDVAEKIMPQTVAITGLQVLEQNYDFDLLSPRALINKNLGNTVRIARRSRQTGETMEWIEGTILSTNGGIIIQMQDGSLESLAPDSNYHMVFDAVPENLRTTPTLSLLLQQPIEGPQQVEMTYLTTGLSWQSDYVLQLDKSGQNATLDSWITLNNQSGIGYQNASLQLLAGDLNLQQPGLRQRKLEETMVYQARGAAEITQQALQGYHLYTVPHKTTIKNKQSKQIKLFAAADIPIKKRLEDRVNVDMHGLEPHKSKPDQWIELVNKAPALGVPLPKGTVRVYSKDKQSNSQFIGEDRIDHTAVNDELEIKLGKAFDISLERKTTTIRQLSKKQIQVEREIRINNGSEQRQQLVVGEIMPSQQWNIRHASQPYQKKSPREAVFDIQIPAMQELTISYQLLVTYP